MEADEPARSLTISVWQRDSGPCVVSLHLLYPAWGPRYGGSVVLGLVSIWYGYTWTKKISSRF